MHCPNMAAQEPGIFPWLESLGARTEVASDLASLDYKSALGRPVMLMTDFLAAHDVWLWFVRGRGITDVLCRWLESTELEVTSVRKVHWRLG